MVEELQYQTLVGRARILTQCFFCGCEIKHGLQFQIFLQSSFHMYDAPPSQNRPPDAQWSKLYQKSLILTYIFPM